MSVLANNRKEAEHEYERKFQMLYSDINALLNKVSKRKEKLYVEPIRSILVELMDVILSMPETYYGRGDGSKEKGMSDKAKEAIILLQTLEKPLMILFTVYSVKKDRRINIVKSINEEMKILSGHVKDENFRYHRIWNLDLQKLSQVDFLDNMQVLLKMIHSKIVRLPQNYASAYTPVLLKISSDAYYELLEANKKIPETQAEFETRRKHLSRAITKLNELQKPFAIACTVLDVSSEFIEEFSDRLEREIQ